MRESFGASFVVGAVIFFVAIFIFFFVAGISYTKAFKIKNRIIDIIEEKGCFDEKNCTAKAEIDAILQETGYRMKPGKPECDSIDRINNIVHNPNVQAEVLTDEFNSYRYCVYKVSSARGNYYGAAAFMYFDMPLGFGTLEFPIYGESKVIEEY